MNRLYRLNSGFCTSSVLGCRYVLMISKSIRDFQFDSVVALPFKVFGKIADAADYVGSYRRNEAKKELWKFDAFKWCCHPNSLPLYSVIIMLLRGDSMQKKPAEQDKYQHLVVGSLLAAHQAMLDAWYSAWESQQRSRLEEHFAKASELGSASHTQKKKQSAAA